MTTVPVAVLTALACGLGVLAAGGRLIVPRPVGASRRRRHERLVGRLQQYLDAAGVAHPPGLVAAGTLGASVLGAGAVVLVVRSVPVAVLAAAAPPVGGWCALRGRVRRRPERVAAQLPEVLRHVADAVRAGMSLRQALGRAGDGAPRPVAVDLAVLAADLDQGARAEDALDALGVRVPHPDVQIAVCAMTVTMRSGGDLPRILTDLAGSIEERGRLAAELAGATSQARMTAGLVAALPAVGAVAVEVASPGTLAHTLGQGVGRVAFVTALALMAVSWLLVRRIARVEP